MVIEYSHTLHDVGDGLKMAGAHNGTIFENADGARGVLSDHSLNYIIVNNMTKIVPVRGTVRGTELCDYVGITGKNAIVAFQNPAYPNRRGALLLTDDGTLTPGLLYNPPEWRGEFTLG